MRVTAKNFFSRSHQDEIMKAISEAEHDTSGEIRVHIETSCKEDVLDRAANLFRKLKMDRTQLRNGVLIYLAVKDRKFAIIGDQGINKVVPPDFWNTTKEEMQQYFREEKFTAGIVHGILQTGHHLKKFFPHQKDDVNELSDEISFGKK
jgi:uncharacterized membrane protein